MNRRALLTGLTTLAVWPMSIRPRPRRELRVVTPEMFGAIPAEPIYSERDLIANRDFIEHMARARGLSI
jgi:hypothetical protein